MSWQDIPGFAAFSDVYRHYIDKVARDGDTVVEIGCLFGRSLAFLHELARKKGVKIRIVAVDPWDGKQWLPPNHPWYRYAAETGGPFEAFQAFMLQYAPEALGEIEIIRKKSTDAVAHFPDAGCGLVLIDGDHRYEEVKKDIRDWRGKVRDGGLLAGDDYSEVGFPGVVAAVRDVLGEDFTVVGTTWLLGKHEVDTSPASPPEESPVAATPALPPAQRDDHAFRCRRDELSSFPAVLQEYALQTLPDLTNPVVLDIGANIGVFSWFALKRWPTATIRAYEPHPETAEYLRGNLADLPVEVIQAAVDHPKTAETAQLFEGTGSSTENSLEVLQWDHGRASQDPSKAVEVSVVDAADLPPCDVLKVDTEGREVPVLRGYKHLSAVKVLLVEAHAVKGDLRAEMTAVAEIAKAAGLTLVGESGTTARFVRNAHPQAAQETWAIVESVGGSYKFGQIVAEQGPEVVLDPCLSIAPEAVACPVPEPGQGIKLALVGADRRLVWGNGKRTQVRWASRTILTMAEAQTLFALYQQQSRPS